MRKDDDYKKPTNFLVVIFTNTHNILQTLLRSLTRQDKAG